MTRDLVLKVSARPDPEAYLSSYLKTHWSRDFLIPKEGVEKPDAYSRKVRVDLDRLDLVHDDATHGRVFVGSRLHDVAEFTMSLKDKEWTIIGTPLAAAMTRAGNLRSTIVVSSETTLAQVAHAQLVHVPGVQMALSPLRNILVKLDSDGRLPMRDLLRSRKSQEQIDKYVTVLQGVDYLRREGDDLVPGPAFPRGTREEPAIEMYDRMLGKVVAQEMTYVRFVLGFSQIVGYLRWANSLYLTAWLAQREGLAISAAELQTRYGQYYGDAHRSGIEVTGQIQRVVDCGVLSRSRDLFTGNAEITPRFFHEAESALPAS